MTSCIFACAWSSPSAANKGTAVGAKPNRHQLLADARRWGCQFQNLDRAAVIASALDLIVIDHALDGRPVQAQDVKAFQRKPDGNRRLVLAYLSVGEAESYRPYWQRKWRTQPPTWIGPENRNWPNSFYVRYWDKAWQDIVFAAKSSFLDDILAAGFDGVFLDRVDAFNDWETENANAKTQMIELVDALARKARAQIPDFIVVGQNSEPLLSFDRYRRIINAVSKESLLYSLNAPDATNTPSDVAWSMQYLKIAQRAGLKILTIEYLQDPQKIPFARTRHEELGFVPFFGNRMLDVLPGSIEDAGLSVR